MTEEWRPVVGFEGMYEVSSLGRVRSLQPRWCNVRILKLWLTRDGYPQVHLRLGNVSKLVRVHRLVAEAFIGKAPKNRPHVNHRDANKQNNRPANLEYVNNEENMAHAAALGKFRGERNSAARLTEGLVREIRGRYVYGSRVLGSKALAREYGMSPYAIQALLSGRTWKHIPLTTKEN